MIMLIEPVVQLFTRSKSRDSLHSGGDGGDWVQTRSKEDKSERKTKSELLSRAGSKFSSRESKEIPKFVLIVEDYSSVSVDTSSVADLNDFEDPVDEKIEESNEQKLESFERNVPITKNATDFQHETEEVSQGAEEDEPAKNPGAESEEKHEETVSNGWETR